MWFVVVFRIVSRAGRVLLGRISRLGACLGCGLSSVSDYFSCVNIYVFCLCVGFEGIMGVGCVVSGMRRFEKQDFPYHLAEGLENIHLTVPDDDAQRALVYIRQFVYRTSGNSELTRGYISEAYLDELVRIRDASSNLDFGSAVEALGVEGGVSTDVSDEFDELCLVEVENSFDAEQSVASIVKEESELSDEARANLYSIRDLITDNRDTVVYYAPREVVGEIMPLLDSKGVLL